MLKSSKVSKISILSRRPVPMAGEDPSVNTIIHTDFNTYEPEVLDKLQGANGVVWALGISQPKATKEDYITITKDSPHAAVKAFSTLSPEREPFRFIYVSGSGATIEPNAFTPFYGRVKGETEIALSKLRTSRFHIESVRPGGVDASNHPAIKPYIPDPGLVYSAVGSVLGPLMRAILRPLHSPTEQLGRFLVGMAMRTYDEQLEVGGNGITNVDGSRILDNWAFRRLYD
uniref:NAD(P)-binding domain-containing protein n=1 Tax=Bionectria ochroleuca TaxID=29856 RepID=A0A0B7KE37_BIOOC